MPDEDVGDGSRDKLRLCIGDPFQQILPRLFRRGAAQRPDSHRVRHLVEPVRQMAGGEMNAMLDGNHGRAGLSVGFILTNNFTLTALVHFHRRAAACRRRWRRQPADPLPVDDHGGSPDPVRAELRHPVRALGAVPTRAVRLYRHRRRPARIRPPVGRAGGGLICAPPSAMVSGLIGVCTGSFVFSRIGLMRGAALLRELVPLPRLLEEFPGPQPVADQLYVVDRDRITCSGGAGVADLAAFPDRAASGARLRPEDDAHHADRQGPSGRASRSRSHRSSQHGPLRTTVSAAPCC